MLANIPVEKILKCVGSSPLFLIYFFNTYANFDAIGLFFT